MTLQEALEAVDSILVVVEGSFGKAGSSINVEEFLEGEEASFFALVDGENALPLESAQDHKRVGDGDTGSNTGGMGGYCPAPVLTQELQSLVMSSIILPTVKGDVETGMQVMMVRLESNLAQVLLAACKGELKSVTFDWVPGSAMAVVMASNGYPESYVKGTKIHNLEEAELAAPRVKIFHAVTALDADENYVATGGHVLGITAKGKDLEEARDRAY